MALILLVAKFCVCLCLTDPSSSPAPLPSLILGKFILPWPIMLSRSRPLLVQLADHLEPLVLRVLDLERPVSLVQSHPDSSNMRLAPILSHCLVPERKSRMFMMSPTSAIGFAGLPKLVTSVSSLQFSPVPVQWIFTMALKPQPLMSSKQALFGKFTGF